MDSFLGLRCFNIFIMFSSKRNWGVLTLCRVTIHTKVCESCICYSKVENGPDETIGHLEEAKEASLASFIPTKIINFL